MDAAAAKYADVNSRPIEERPCSLATKRRFGASSRNLEAIEDPEVARVAAQGEYLMEVFPALALASYSPAFGYRKGPRYNPDRKTFRIEDWIATIDAAINEATRFSCLQLVAWLTGLRTIWLREKSIRIA